MAFCYALKKGIFIMSKKRFVLPLTVFALLLSFGLAACNNAENSGNSDAGDVSAETTSQKQDESKQQSSSEGKPSSAKQEKINITAAGDKTKLMYGETVQLTADQEGVTWISSKPEIASVDGNGLVTALDKGSASIKASKEGFRDGTISISVDFPNITVTADKTSLLVAETANLTASEQGVVWTSSDPTIVSVENGVATALKIGSATIKASKEHFNDGSVTINVVRPAPTATLHWEDANHYSTNDDWSSSGRGGGETPVYTPNGGQPSDGTCIAYFENGDKETLTFTSDKACRAEIVITMLYRSAVSNLGTCFTAKFNNSEDILFTGIAYPGDYAAFELSIGEFTLVNGNNVLEINFLGSSPYLDDINIYAAEAANIAVVQPAAKPDVTVNETSLTVAEGKTTTITSSMTGLTYRSNNTAIATVDDNGVVSGVKAGETTISISKDGYKTLKLPVTVTEAEGVIKVEAEQNQTAAEALGITFRTPSSSSNASGAVTLAWPVDAVLSVTFDDTAAKDYTLYLVGRANGGSNGYTYTDVDLATDVQITVNGTVLTPTGTISGSTITAYSLGQITSKVGSNTIEVKCITLAPTIDFFKLIPTA